MLLTKSKRQHMLQQYSTKAAYALLLVALALGPVMPKCDSFCLKCSNQKCQICDFTRNKALDQNSNCVDSSLSQCQVAVQSTKCLKCQSGFGADSSSGRCVSGALDNCTSYSSSGQCSKCRDGFGLNGSLQCESLPSTPSVPNCRLYQQVSVAVPAESGAQSANGEWRPASNLGASSMTVLTGGVANSVENRLICVECQSNYTLTASGSCAPSSRANCASVSNLICRNCVSDYSIKRNYFLRLHMSSASKAPNLGLLYAQFDSQDNFVARPRCSKFASDNCAKSVFGNLCIECAKGYYPSAASTCEKIDVEYAIDSCAAYESKTRCRTCQAGFHLESDGSKCTVDDVIAHCEIYQNGRATSTELDGQTNCRVCQGGFEVVEGRCVHKGQVRLVEDCLSYNYQGNFCEQCKEGRRLSDDRQICSVFIQFCRVYFVQQLGSNPGTRSLRMTNGQS